jgi:hypothetical protein
MLLLLLETHYQFEAFLFRCIRAWLRKKRNGTSVIGVFSTTSSAILNNTLTTGLWKEYELDQEETPSSRDLGERIEYYIRGSRTFDPFFTLTTMGVLQPTREIPNQSDYDKSICYGRPLFAKLHENNELETKLGSVIRRLLLDTGEKGFDWTKQSESCLSVLATRVQFGSTNLNVSSQLIEKGYAYLTGFTSNFAKFVYMNDPVCARLAMCMMDENWRFESWRGKNKRWWCEMVNTYSTGLCRSDEGNVEEVVTALYFLFCCDECRQNIDGNMNYTWFAVPLED